MKMEIETVWFGFLFSNISVKLVIVKYHSTTVFHFVAVSIKSINSKISDSLRENLKKMFTGILLLKLDEMTLIQSFNTDWLLIKKETFCQSI